MHEYCVIMIDEPRSVRLGSAELRVLAHPLRSRLLSALRSYGPATATALAQRLSTNSGATSYHLRQLADVGLIEEDPERGTGRERWWRAAHEWTTWSETDFADDPDDRAAADWLLGHYVRTFTGWVGDWLERRREWPLIWREAADQSDYQFHLTPEGLAALNHELHEVIRRHRREADPALPGAERVTVLLQSFPMPDLRL
jgi:DNA-binding transcriptional ArsR family regulator